MEVDLENRKRTVDNDPLLLKYFIFEILHRNPRIEGDPGMTHLFYDGVLS